MSILKSKFYGEKKYINTNYIYIYREKYFRHSDMAHLLIVLI
jgi:hypothetical protein